MNINQQVESLNEVAFIEKAYYTSYIESLNESLNIAEKIRDNYKQKKEDYEVLYDNGDCTLLDVQTYSVQFLIRQLQIENIKDELWYYSWLLMNVD